MTAVSTPPAAPTTTTPFERRFAAMGTEVHLVLHGRRSDATERIADRIQARIADLETRWSRFRPDSEISALNRAAGTPLSVSAPTVLLVRRAIEAWHRTGGTFDPLVLPAMLAAGYTATFDDVLSGDAPATEPAAEVEPAVGCGDRVFDPGDIAVDGFAVTLPAGTGFDPGGIGKGLAADLVVDEFRDDLIGLCLNLGGDLRVAGPAPDGGPWVIALDHPDTGEVLTRIVLADGAVATSTPRRRRWRTAAGEVHHVIDPSTGRPAAQPLRQATVVAATGWVAEALATSVLLRRPAHAFDIVDGTGAVAVALDDDGTLYRSDGFARFEARAAELTQ